MNEPCYYRISVKGIVIDDEDRVLLTKESDGRWELLGGGLDHREDPIDGLRREIWEETGVRVTRVSTRPKYFLTCPRENSDTFTANVIYEIQLESYDFTPSDECRELRFFAVNDMDMVELFPNVRELQRILKTAPPKSELWDKVNRGSQGVPGKMQGVEHGTAAKS